MKGKNSVAFERHAGSSIRLFCYLTIGLVFCLSIPFWVAFSSGLASVSLFVFGLTSFVVMTALIISRQSTHLMVATLCCSLFALFMPQLAFINSAKTTGTSLSFDPKSYLSFKGETELLPTKEISYKSIGKARLHMAFYASNAPGTRPTVIFLHGGGWRYGDHRQLAGWPSLLTRAGYHVLSVEYRLSNDTYHSWRDAPADVHDAVAYVSDHHQQYAIDPSQLHLMGQSAGGHLALLEAYKYDDVRSVIALYAPIDLKLDYMTSRDKSTEMNFIGGPPHAYPDRYRSLSPLTYVSRSVPPSLLIQGKRDDLVSYQNTLRLHDALSRLGQPHQLVLLPFSGHSFDNQRGGFATQIAEQTVLQFLK